MNVIFHMVTGTPERMSKNWEFNNAIKKFEFTMSVTKSNVKLSKDFLDHKPLSTEPVII